MKLETDVDGMFHHFRHAIMTPCLWACFRPLNSQNNKMVLIYKHCELFPLADLKVELELRSMWPWDLKPEVPLI